MRSGWRCIIPVILLLLSVLCTPVSALEVPSRPQGYVTDKAALLSSSARTQLNQALRQFEAQTSIQIVVATFPSLEQESLEDFSIRLAEKWKIGNKKNDNGVILLIFKAERLMRIEVGYGLEGALPDVLAGTIIRNDITPYFKQGKYEAGIFKGVQSITQAVQGEYRAGKTSSYSRRSSRGRELTPEEMEALKRQAVIVFFIILIGVAGLFLVDIKRYFGYRKEHSLYNERYSFWEWFFRFAVLLAVLSVVFRMLFYMMLFSRGGYGGGRGGGGFSGGGGSFGGGGASGSW